MRQNLRHSLTDRFKTLMENSGHHNEHFYIILVKTSIKFKERLHGIMENMMKTRIVMYVMVK